MLERTDNGTQRNYRDPIYGLLATANYNVETDQYDIEVDELSNMPAMSFASLAACNWYAEAVLEELIAFGH